MHKIILIITAAAALSGCQMTTAQQDDVTGALAGGALGFITAKALGASTDWAVVAALGTAAAGVLVARNTQNGSCAYSNGDGTYYTAPCP